MKGKSIGFILISFLLVGCGQSGVSIPVVGSSTATNDSTTSKIVLDPKKVEVYSYQPILSDTIPQIEVSTSSTDLSYATQPDRKDKWDYTTCEVTLKEEGKEDITGIKGGIKVRGNYTANYEKKPFRFKFDKKQEILSLNDSNKMKSWVLLAEYKDSSMLRNILSFYLGKTILGSDGFHSSDFRPVQLTLDNQYWGLYTLCEQQQVNKYRVNITEPEKKSKETKIGYLMEYDGYYSDEPPVEEGGDYTFTIDYNNHQSYQTANGKWVTPSQDGFTIKSDITDISQRDYISNYIDKLYELCFDAIINHDYRDFDTQKENLISSTTANTEEVISRYIDVDSLVDTYLLNEIACDPDLGWSSFYMDIDFASDDTRLRFEAPWDYDSAYGLKKGFIASGEGMYASDSSNPWLSLFYKEDWFQKKVKDKWMELLYYGVLKNSLSLLNDYARKYVSSYQKNFNRWPKSIGYNKTLDDEVRSETRNFKVEKDAEVFLYDWLYQRYNYLNTVFGDKTDVLTGKKQNLGELDIPSSYQGYRYEIENATYSGGRLKNGNGSSGNQYLGNLDGTEGIRMTFTINSSTDQDSILALGLSSQQNNEKLKNWYSLSLNGVDIPIINSTVKGAGDQFNWHNWVEVTAAQVHLNKGTNTITITTKNHSTNFDYLEVYAEGRLS